MTTIQSPHHEEKTMDRDETVERINELIFNDELDRAAELLSDLPGDDEWEAVARQLADEAAQVNHGAAKHEEMYALAGRLEIVADIVRRSGKLHDPMP